MYRYTCMYNFKIYWHKEQKRNMSVKQGIHKWSLIRKYKYGCLMHIETQITAELKVCWLSSFYLGVLYFDTASFGGSSYLCIGVRQPDDNHKITSLVKKYQITFFQFEDLIIATSFSLTQHRKFCPVSFAYQRSL